MINQDLIRQARQVDLAEYLISHGEPLKKDGRERYKHAQHNSLVFTQNAFWWNSRDLHGNAIDFLMEYYGMDFKTALAELTGSNLDTIKKELAPATKLKQVPDLNGLYRSDTFSLPQLSENMRRAFAYLIKTRKIDAEIVQSLAKRQKLYQDQRGNIVFPWLDKHQKIVGAELNGTLTDKRFKGIVHGSKYGYGYNVTFAPFQLHNNIYFFESAIDLLSFWTLNKGNTRGMMLVSMAGLKKEVVECFLRRSERPLNVHLCVDTDKAGKAFVEAVQSQMKAEYCPPPEGKDWNEYLIQFKS